MSDLFDLATYMNALVSRIPGAANERSKQVVQAVIEDLVMSTPVDTGSALSNWIVSLGEPATDIIPPYSPSPKGRTVNGVWTHSADPSLTRAANAPQVIEAAIQILQAKQAGVPIYISNNVTYIGYLNEGSSSQAPGGFVDRAMVIAQEIVDRSNILA